MKNINDIIVNKVEWDKELTNSRLEFNVSGENINNVIVNTLRRVCLTNIPIYAFTNINISYNTSVFNNNYLKLRLNNLPVLGLETTNHIYEKKKNKNVDEINNVNMDDITLNVNDDINVSTLEKLTLFLDYENNTNDIVSVGTTQCKFYLKEKQIDSPYPINIILIKLQPKQKIKFSAITELGIEEKSSIFSPVSIFTFIENKDNDYNVILESKGQLNELKILDICNSNIQNILDDIDERIPDDKSLEGNLILKSINHTIGNILVTGMSYHEDVIFAGYNMPHPLDNKIIIHFKLKNNNLKKIISDVIKHYKIIFNNLNKKIQKI